MDSNMCVMGPCWCSFWRGKEQFRGKGYALPRSVTFLQRGDLSAQRDLCSSLFSKASNCQRSLARIASGSLASAITGAGASECQQPPALYVARPVTLIGSAPNKCTCRSPWQQPTPLPLSGNFLFDPEEGAVCNL